MSTPHTCWLCEGKGVVSASVFERFDSTGSTLADLDVDCPRCRNALVG